MVIPSAGARPRVLAGTCKRELACKVGPVLLLTAVLEVPGHPCRGAGACPQRVRVWCLLPQQAGEDGPELCPGEWTAGAEPALDWNPSMVWFLFDIFYVEITI